MTIRESWSAGPAVKRTLAYNSRGTPLIQSRKCFIRDGAVARWKRLPEVESGCGDVESVREDVLDQVSGEHDGNRIRLDFVARDDPERRTCSSDSPPQLYDGLSDYPKKRTKAGILTRVLFFACNNDTSVCEHHLHFDQIVDAQSV